MQEAMSDEMNGASDEEDATMYQNPISKTPSQDIFYKGELKGQRVEKTKNAHSQSMH